MAATETLSAADTSTQTQNAPTSTKPPTTLPLQNNIQRAIAAMPGVGVADCGYVACMA